MNRAITGNASMTAIIAEIDSIVKFGEVTKCQRKIYIIGDDGEEREGSLPRGVDVNVQEGERLKAGEPLMDGPRNPHDILSVPGSVPSAGRQH